MNNYDIPFFDIKDYHSKFESKGMLRQYSTINRMIKNQQREIFLLKYSGTLPDIDSLFLSEDEFILINKFFQLYDDYVRMIDKIKKI